MKEEILDHLVSFGQNAFKLFAGLLAAMFGYFIPIKDFVHLLLFLLIVDMLFGFWANRKTKGEKFLMEKVWGVTVPRMVVMTVFIMCAYLWDVVYEQKAFQTYIIAGWILSGVTLASIAQNGYKITNWKAFNEIGGLILEKLPISKKKNSDKQEE